MTSLDMIDEHDELKEFIIKIDELIDKNFLSTTLGAAMFVGK